MKLKKIACLLAVLAASLCLFACNGAPMSEDKRYKALNDMLNADYSEVTLTVTTRFSEEAFLKSVYVITPDGEDRKVAYTAERFAGLSLGDGGAEQEKELLTGEAVYRGGYLLSRTGDAVPLPGVLAGGLSFREECFSNAELTDLTLRADVPDAAAFLGISSCTDMKAEATFLDRFLHIGVTFLDGEGFAVGYSFDFKA